MDGLTIEAARVLVSKEPYSHLFYLVFYFGRCAFFSTFFNCDSSLQRETGKDQFFADFPCSHQGQHSVKGMTTSLVPNHQAVQLDAEVHPILYKRQLDIQDTSALHHQTMPTGNVKSKPVSAKVPLINCSPHCSGSWSLHQQGKMPHSHMIMHLLPWTVSVRKQKLVTDSLASAKWPYFWGRKNQAKKNAKPVSSVWKSPTEDALQVQQVQ